MIYALLRAVAGVALRWYYRSIDVVGMDRVPRRGPVLLVVNHPNALVDALVVGWVLPRRMQLTAKATLFRNPIGAWLLRRVGVVPLQRASDVQAGRGTGDPSRNAESFRAVSARLRAGGAVLIFPEGKSHDEPALAEIRTGAARIALEAVRTGGVQGLSIVPVGLHFERKERPSTRVLAQVGDPIAVDAWRDADERTAVPALTAEIERRLRAVTLNFETHAEAMATTSLAASLAAVVAEESVPSLGAVAPLEREIALARRLAAARREVEDDALGARAGAFLARQEAFESALRAAELRVRDLGIDTGTASGARFVIREGALLALAGPVAVWGAVNHYLPFQLARAIAMRRVESASDPAMRTIVAGSAFVLGFYALQTTVVWHLLGAIAAALYVVSLPVAAELRFGLAARLTRARERARAYRRFRRRPDVQRRFLDELSWLRQEASALDREVTRAAALREA